MAVIKLQIVGHQGPLKKLIELQDRDRIPPTLIFAGPEGVGKKRAALAWVQRMFCSEVSACGECGHCQRVAQQQHERLLLVSPSGTQIKVEQAQQILSFIRLRTEQGLRFVVIDEAHLMNSQTSNALLKSLEEPPEGVHFILVSSLASGLLATIRSRSQTVQFGGLSDQDLKAIVPHAEDWKIRSAQGSVARLLKLEDDDFTELREEAQRWIKNLAEQKNLMQLNLEKPIWDDKESIFKFVRVMQQLVRDHLYRDHSLEPLIHGDAGQDKDAISSRRWDEIFQKLIVLERDLLAHRDRKLAMEDLVIHFQSELGSVNGSPHGLA